MIISEVSYTCIGEMIATTHSPFISVFTLDLIHYSFMPLILFCVTYTLNLLTYYLSIANGSGGIYIGILNLMCYIKAIELIIR